MRIGVEALRLALLAVDDVLVGREPSEGLEVFGEVVGVLEVVVTAGSLSRPLLRALSIFVSPLPNYQTTSLCWRNRLVHTSNSIKLLFSQTFARHVSNG